MKFALDPSLTRLYQPLTLAVAALVVGMSQTPLIADDPFEGRIKMTVSEGATEQTIDYYVKGDRMRVETEDPRGQGGVVIMNMKNKEILMLMPEQRMYMTMPLPEIENDFDQEGQEPERTGETRTILERNSHQYLITDGDAEYEVWATDELGAFAGLRLPNQTESGAASSRDRALAEQDFFPLLIIERRNGQEENRVEVTEIEAAALPDSLFEAPADFRGLTMPTELSR